MTKRKNVPAKKPAQTSVTLVGSLDPDEIAKEMAETVDGWDDMPEAVKKEIIALNQYAMSVQNPPTMRINEAVIDMNAKNPQLHTLRLMRTFASTSADFINYMVSRLANGLKGASGLTTESFNGGLAFIHGLQPKSEAEAMLALQMFLTNDAAMRTMRLCNGSDWADTVHQMGNLSVKFMRTFAMQAEALAKLQRGGVQTVKHIHVDNRGGQAVFAEQVHQEGTNGKIENQPYEPSAALPCQNSAGVVVPMSSYSGQEALPDSRRG